MASQKINFGVIGLGWPGRMHSQAILATRGARLRSIADADDARRATHIKEFPAEKTFSTHQELLADPDLDAVIVCLPNFLHFPVSLAALKAGKHVLCEKPPTLETREMKRLRAEATRRKRVYAFGRQMRFGGEIVAARKLIKAGKLGDVYFARTTWWRNRGIPIGIGSWFLDRAKAGGGAMIDLGIHALDNAWFLMGSPRPLTVSAQVFQKFAHTVPKGASFDVDDCGFAFIRFENGAVLSLETAWASNLPDSQMPNANGAIQCTLHGNKGSLQLYPPVISSGDSSHVTETQIAVEEGNPFIHQLADFARAIRTGGRPLSDADHAVSLMEMLDAIYQSSRLGREVRIPKP